MSVLPVCVNPTGDRVIDPDSTGEVTSSADGLEFVGGRRLLASDDVRPSPPTDCGSSQIQATGEVEPAVKRDQRLAGRTVPTTMFTRIRLRSPADSPVVFPQRARVIGPAADGYELLVVGGSCLAVLITSPAEGRSVFTQPAGVVPAAPDGEKTLTIGRSGLASMVSSPADCLPILSKATDVGFPTADLS